MSKIQAELVEALEISRAVVNGDRQDLLKAILRASNKMSNDEFNKLTDPAADWLNAAADAVNAKAKELPDFPDLVKEEPEPTSRRRRAAAEEDPAPTGTKEITKASKGMAIRVVTKRGKDVSGIVVEVDKEVLVIKTGDGEEQEFDLDRIDKMYALDTAGGADDGDEEDPIKVGAEVKVVTKRGKEHTGKIIELKEDLLVIDDGKDELEFDRDRVESITPLKAAKEDAPTTRRRAAADDKGSDKGSDKGGDDKRTRSSNEGVSVGQRIKELIAEDFERDVVAIGKILEKEGLEFRENTLKMNFGDAHKFIEILRKAKRLK